MRTTLLALTLTLVGCGNGIGLTALGDDGTGGTDGSSPYSAGGSSSSDGGSSSSSGDGGSSGGSGNNSGDGGSSS